MGSVDTSEHGGSPPPVGSLLYKAGAGLRLGARPQQLCVFGPTGGTGQAVVRMALSRGWAVTAFARRPERLAQEVCACRWCGLGGCSRGVGRSLLGLRDGGVGCLAVGLDLATAFEGERRPEADRFFFCVRLCRC
jgi:hypothetical protein